MSRIKRVREWWGAERYRHFLVYGTAFAVGIALYFALPTEPSWVALSAALAGIAGAAASMRYVRVWMLPICLMVAGVAWASFYTYSHPVTILDRAMTPRPVTGIVTDVERTENGLRITLDKVTINRLPEDQTPERVRLTLRLKQDAALEFPRVGSRIELLAGLLPPMGPAMPHGFDFARYFYFRGIGAVGYGLPPWKLLPELPRNGLVEQFVNWRIDLTESIITQLGPRHGPIAAGLITGEDRAIQETDYEALKAANLYHIIAISGGHMVVISGLVFLLARWLLLCLPGSLRYRPEMKSLAASITLALVTLYLFVTGMPPSAVRAYVMIALVLLAVMLRRQVDPMRSLVVAALIMLVLDPSDLFEPGFQLSFLATLAIVALVERIFMRPNLSATLPSRLGRLLLTTFLISLVAEAATAPLVIAQFNQFAIYGVPANMIATPLVSLLLMPVVALFFVLLPFGAEQPALWALNFGIEALLRIAHEVASWPQARIFLPSLPGWGLTMFVLGLLWFCFFLRRPRWLGVPVMAVGILSLYTNHVPDLLVGSEVKQIALRTDDGYMLARGRSDSMIPQLWANGLGHEELPAIGRKHTAWRCDRLGCVGVIDKKRIAFPTLPAAVLDDCRLSDVLVTPLRRLRCDHAWVISGWDLRHKGTHAFWLEDGRFRIETSADWQGKRPWSSQ